MFLFGDTYKENQFKQQRQLSQTDRTSAGAVDFGASFVVKYKS